MLIAAWVNGVPQETVAMTERGFAYGDGHFTTLAVRQGQALLGELHWRRLHEACDRLGISTRHFPLWRESFSRFCTQYPDITARIVITRGSGGRGYLPDAYAEPNIYFQAWPVAPHPSVWREQGIPTGILSGRLGVSPMLAGLKHLNRLEQVVLRRELALTPYPEAIVLNVDDEVVEGVFSNVFLVRDGVLHTPPLERSGVAGVMRAYLLEAVGGLGIPVRTTPLRVSDLDTADALFFCNSLAGIWPVARFGGRMMPPDPVTRSLQKHLNDARLTP